MQCALEFKTFVVFCFIINNHIFIKKNKNMPSCVRCGFGIADIPAKNMRTLCSQEGLLCKNVILELLIVMHLFA